LAKIVPFKRRGGETMNGQNGQLILLCISLLFVGALVAWSFPRPCKHCGKWVIPGSRYVFHDGFHGDNYTHFDLHDKCSAQYFSPKERTSETGLEKHLKPIPEFGRFILDESWLIILVLVGFGVLLYTRSFFWAIAAGLIAAMATRAATMLILRFVFGINPQLVKPHDRGEQKFLRKYMGLENK
jgi:hypothetical protein